ncbi:MAG: ketopantoate reductase family protein [Armatimonadetes bacterium]|nr:ketopantoate reductase family protein [Armatimonadota bacterium]
MRVFCYGAGAVGSLLGGRLSAAGHDVTLLARPDSAAALRQHGLTIALSDGSALRALPRVVTEMAEASPAAPPPDLIIVAVKGYDTAAAAPEVARACGPRTAILSVQNGLGNEELLAAAMGAGRVIAGSFTLSVAMAEPGRVAQHTTSGGLALAEVETSGGDRLARLVRAFEGAGMRAVACPDWRAMKWSKLLLNLLANASCAILSMSPAEVFADARLFRLEQRAFREARRTMRRLGLRPVDLPGYPVRLLCGAMGLPAPLARPLIAARAAGGRGDKPPSLALDVARGRSEVAFLNGAVARAAAEIGMPAPVNALLASTLEGIVRGVLNPAEFHRRPEALLGALRSSSARVRQG